MKPAGLRRRFVTDATISGCRAVRSLLFGVPYMLHSPFNESDRALLQLAIALRDSGYRFTTPTPATHERVNARPENAFARTLEDVFGWSRPFDPEILPPDLWQLMRAAGIAIPCGEKTKSAVRLSSLGQPGIEQLFLHSAFPTVEADAVFFGPDTYRFALALEGWFALQIASGGAPIRRAVDIGTGAGPGAIVSALHLPAAEVVAVDINEAALRFTRINAALAGLSNLEARISNLLGDVEGSFDLIVANPPYLVDASERAYRHGGGPLGAGLSLAIVDAALERLSPGGTLLLYTGVAILNGKDRFWEAVAPKLTPDVSWTYREVDPDVFGEELGGGAYASCDRIAAVVLTVSKMT